MSTPRQIAIARLTGIAARYAGHYSGQEDDDEAAVAELRQVSTDPDVLSEAASFYANAGELRAHYAPKAVALLIQAGATAEQTARWADEWAKRKRGGFNLSTLADQGSD